MNKQSDKIPQPVLSRPNELLREESSWTHFYTSNNNYFYLNDLERNIWRFFIDGKETSFYIIGAPEYYFKNTDLTAVDKISYYFSNFGIKIMYAEVLVLTINSDLFDSYKIINSLELCSVRFHGINMLFDMFGTSITDEKLKYYIRENCL